MIAKREDERIKEIRMERHLETDLNLVAARLDGHL